MNRFWKIVRKVGYFLSAAALIGWLVLLSSIISAPLIPDPSANRTVEFNNHGTIHYITPEQDFLLRRVFPCLLVIFFLCAGISFRSKLLRQGGY